MLSTIFHVVVGIEIPDYVASPNKGNLLKAIQNRMVAAGK